jgi:hypothetical protein
MCGTHRRIALKRLARYMTVYWPQLNKTVRRDRIFCGCLVPNAVRNNFSRSQPYMRLTVLFQVKNYLVVDNAGVTFKVRSQPDHRIG